MGNNVDLLLINPGNHKQIYQKLASELAAIEPPIWAGLIASYIQIKGFSVQILDANAENLGPGEVADRVSLMKPLLTAIVAYGHNPQASTTVMPAAGLICKAIKESDADTKTLLVGGHVAAVPKRTLLEEEVDFVCGGEGPITTSELIKALKTANPDFSKVRGLWYLHGDDAISTSPAPNVQSLDNEMPDIAWDLLPVDRYRAHNWHCFDHIDSRQPYGALYTTLGCPFKCTFCCIQAPFKSGEKALGIKEKINSYRRWSPQTVLAQIDTLVKRFDVKNIKFADEIFVLNQGHVDGICDLIIERGYDLNIWAYARVDSINNKIVKKMKRAGIKWLCLGIESGSQRVRSDVRKGYSQEDLFKAVDIVRSNGIYIIANYLFGLPEDDLNSMKETLDIAVDLNTEFANFYCAMAYPGSELYKQALEKRLPLPDSWLGYSQLGYDALPLPTNYLSGAQVLKFRDKAFQKYFNNPEYLEMILKKFGGHVVDHVKEMSRVPLKRKY